MQTYRTIGGLEEIREQAFALDSFGDSLVENDYRKPLVWGGCNLATQTLPLPGCQRQLFPAVFRTCTTTPALSTVSSVGRDDIAAQMTHVSTWPSSSMYC